MLNILANNKASLRVTIKEPEKKLMTFKLCFRDFARGPR